MLSGFLKGLKTNIFGKSPARSGSGTSGPTKTDNIGLTQTPISSLDGNPLRFGTYQFPKDVFDNQQLGHYMVFYVNQQDRQRYDYRDTAMGKDESFTFSGTLGGGDEYTGLRADRNRLQVKNNQVTGGSYSAGAQDKGEDLSATSYDRNTASMQGLQRTRKTTTRISDSIALYLPGQVTDNTSALYEDLSMGIGGMAVNKLFGAAKDFANKDFESFGENFTLGVGSVLGEAGRRFLVAAGEGLTGAEGLVQGVNKLFGQADNPFVEVFFTNMNLRKFTYNFVFAPRNEDETNEIQQIIQLFRFHMVPELQGTNGRYITLPSTFDIHYMYKANNGNSYENDYYTRLSTCVLQDCSVNYTPTGVKSFGDGAPTQITMNLTFSETEALTKEKVKQGY